jgi:hypothetical protein
LIAEGRTLTRQALALRPNGKNYVAIWGGTGVVPLAKKGEWQHRFSFACHALPQNPHKFTGVISLYMNVERKHFGKTAVVPDPQATLPTKTDGEKLYGHPFECLPPVEVVLDQGSQAVQDWVEDIGWTVDDDAPLHKPVGDYIREYMQHHPYFTWDCDAMLGGWLMPFPEGDWKKFASKPLLIFTIRDAEPHYELWDDHGRLKLVERIT